jgi:hypothetical protein
VSEDGKTRVSANGTKWGATLQTAVAMYPTVLAGDSHTAAPNQNTQSLGRHIRRLDGTGGLNPAWVEWLMGFPPGWTDLKD